MQSELSVEIQRPIDQVFEYTTKHVADWSITCVEDEVLDEKPEGVGTTFRIVTEEGGRKTELHGVVTRHEPPKTSACHLRGEQFEIDVLYTFEELAGGTRVTQSTVVRGKGFLKLVFGLFGWLIKRSSCKAQEAELASLKQKCEALGAAV